MSDKSFFDHDTTLKIKVDDTINTSSDPMSNPAEQVATSDDTPGPSEAADQPKATPQGSKKNSPAPSPGHTPQESKKNSPAPSPGHTPQVSKTNTPVPSPSHTPKGSRPNSPAPTPDPQAAQLAPGVLNQGSHVAIQTSQAVTVTAAGQLPASNQTNMNSGGNAQPQVSGAPPQPPGTPQPIGTQPQSYQANMNSTFTHTSQVPTHMTTSVVPPLQQPQASHIYSSLQQPMPPPQNAYAVQSLQLQPTIPQPAQPNVFNMDMGLLGKHIKGISMTLDSYKGLNQDKSIDDFITDLQDYAHDTASCPIQTCKSKLKDEAREFFRELMTTEPYANHQNDLPFTEAQINDFYDKLRDRFTLSDAQKQAAYIEVFSMKQLSGELFTEFIQRVQKRCRTLNVDKQHVLGICIGGAAPSIRPFIITSAPKDIQSLLTLPISRQESLVAPAPNTLAVNAIEDKDTTSHHVVAAIESVKHDIKRDINALEKKVSLAANADRDTRSASRPSDNQFTNYRNGEAPDRARSPSPMPKSSTYTPGNNDTHQFHSRNNTPSPTMVNQDTPRFNGDNHYQNQSQPRVQGAQYNRSNVHREYQDNSHPNGNVGIRSRCHKCDQFCGFVMNEGDITYCNAYNVLCRFCFVKGHYAQVCFKRLSHSPSYR